MAHNTFTIVVDDLEADPARFQTHSKARFERIETAALCE